MSKKLYYANELGVFDVAIIDSNLIQDQLLKVRQLNSNKILKICVNSLYVHKEDAVQKTEQLKRQHIDRMKSKFITVIDIVQHLLYRDVRQPTPPYENLAILERLEELGHPIEPIK